MTTIYEFECSGCQMVGISTTTCKYTITENDDFIPTIPYECFEGCEWCEWRPTKINKLGE